jgi:hypothetical protein
MNVEEEAVVVADFVFIHLARLTNRNRNCIALSYLFR